MSKQRNTAGGILSKLISGYEVRTRFVTTIAPPEKIVDSNPNRWSLLFSENAGISIAPDSRIGGGSPGFSLATMFSVNVRDHGPLAMMDWFCFGVAGLQLMIVEVIKL